jgi:hypothetical protein
MRGRDEDDGENDLTGSAIRLWRFRRGWNGSRCEPSRGVQWRVEVVVALGKIEPSAERGRNARSASIATSVPAHPETVSCASPGGTNENSPAFQRRVRVYGDITVPEGRLKRRFQPSLRDSLFWAGIPALKRRAFLKHPFGMR